MFTRRTIALAGSIAVALALSACGRVGPLEPPPGPSAVPAPTAQVIQPDVPLTPSAAADAAAQKTGFDAQGNPVATTGPKRPFILDPILN